MKDDRRTPRWFFEQCIARFGEFELDIAANEANHLCDTWLGPGSREGENTFKLTEDDWARLVHFHAGDGRLRNWCNPPYGPAGVIPRWIKLARWLRDEFSMRTLMLLPADTSTAWFNDVWRTELCELVPFRLAFESPTDKSGNSAKFGSVLVWIAPRIDTNGRRPQK